MILIRQRKGEKRSRFSPLFYIKLGYVLLSSVINQLTIATTVNVVIAVKMAGAILIVFATNIRYIISASNRILGIVQPATLIFRYTPFKFYPSESKKVAMMSTCSLNPVRIIQKTQQISKHFLILHYN